jgi:glucokinase
VLRAPNLVGFDQPVPLAALVAAAAGGNPVYLDNDVNAATLAEHRLGAGVGVDDLLAVFVGTGVGGGLVLDGRLRRGPQGVAGEIGHLVVRAGGRRCGCGSAGHLEAYAGRASLEREARRRHEAGQATALVDLAGNGRMKASVLAKAMARGDAVAVALLEEAVEALGEALASAVNLLDLSLLVLGGGVTDKLGADFVARVGAAVRARLFLPDAPVRVVAAGLGDRAGAMGAALLGD